MRPVSPVGSGSPSSSRISTRVWGGGRRPCPVPRAGPRRRDRRPGHLGGAVEVVEHVAELVHEGVAQPAAERRAAADDRRAGGSCRTRASSGGRSMMRWSIAGTTATDSTRWRSIAASVALGSKRAEHDACSRAQAEHELAVARARETGARDQVARPGLERHHLQQLRERLEPSRRARRAPFGVPVVPEVRITGASLLGGGARGSRRPVSIRC